MQGRLSSSEGVPQTCTAVEASETLSHLSGRLDQYEMLKSFVDASHARGIVSGVQVKLMLELAEELAFPSSDAVVCTADDAAPQESVPTAAAAVHDKAAEPVSQSREATPVQLPPANDSCNSSMTGTAVVPGSAFEAGINMQQPQLHIQPLDLHSQLTPSPLSSGIAANSSCDALHLQQCLPSSTISLAQQQASSLLGLTPAFLAAAQAAAAAHSATTKQQFGLSSKPESGIIAQQSTDPMAASAGCLNHSPAVTAATASYGTAAACGLRPSAARKHKFTREQHAAILESVERNYALYPSRYTELVIREMQTMFPGIEINNACVRKIKFRANEATKQGTISGYSPGVVPAAGSFGVDSASCRESEAAAEAACGLVGLASAAAGAADLQTDVELVGSPPPIDTSSPCRADRQTEAAVVCDAFGDQGVAGALQQQQQQQPLPLPLPEAMPTEAVEQQQQPAGPNGLVTEDSFIDSATAAAAEAMHMLASCSGRTEPCISSSLKRKAEGLAGDDVEGSCPAAEGSGCIGGANADADAPTASQIAQALAAAAGLGSSDAADPAGFSSSANQPCLLGQALQWSSTAAMLQAAAAAAGPQQQQQLQQQSLSRHNSAASLPAPIAVAAAAAIPSAKRQRLSGVQMAELVASVRHHVQVNPERYTHCVIKDMKEKYPDLDLNMGQIRKIKFRTLGNMNPRQAGKAAQQQQATACTPAAAAAMPRPLTTGAETGVAAGQLHAHSSPSPAAVAPLSFTWDAAKALEAVAAAASAAAASMPLLQ